MNRGLDRGESGGAVNHGVDRGGSGGAVNHGVDLGGSARRAAGRIFINYRRDDARGAAGRLADSLNRYFGSERVFRDVDGIEAGANFEEVLHHTAHGADAMIVLIGSQWASLVDEHGRARLHDPEDWVAREIAAAIERKIPIFPVLLESASMPRAAELPARLQPLVRYNAMSVSDQRWAADVTRLARVLALDLPGSAAERTLHTVQWVVSLALFLSVTLTASRVAWNATVGASPLLSIAESGATFVVVSGSVIVLLYFARFVEAAARRWMFAAVGAGVLGTFGFFVWYKFLSLDKAAMIMFAGSTMTATAVLALMNLSRFKAR